MSHHDLPPLYYILGNPLENYFLTPLTLSESRLIIVNVSESQSTSGVKGEVDGAE